MAARATAAPLLRGLATMYVQDSRFAGNIGEFCADRTPVLATVVRENGKRPGGSPPQIRRLAAVVWTMRW